MYEEVMKLVPTFKQLISEFDSQPEQLDSFFTLVCYIHLSQKRSLLIHS